MPNKTKRISEFFIFDIFIAIDSINRHSIEMEAVEDLTSNELVYNSIMRSLEIIGEAMKNVLKNTTLKELSKPDWRNIVDFRNIVAHEYFGINYEEILNIIKVELPELEKDLFLFIKKLKNNSNLILALDGTYKDLETINRKESLEYLVKIKKYLKNGF